MGVEHITKVFDEFAPVEGVSEVGQALHKQVLNEVTEWNDATPWKIARYMLTWGKEQSDLWLRDLHDQLWLESKDPEMIRVYQVAICMLAVKAEKAQLRAELDRRRFRTD